MTVLWGTAIFNLYPLYSWQDVLLTFAEIELDSTTMFAPGTNVMFIRSTGEPVLAQVVGHLEHGDAYRCISYERDGKTVLRDRASVRRLSLPRNFTPSWSRSRSPYSPLNTSYAEFFRFMLQLLVPANLCVWW